MVLSFENMVMVFFFQGELLEDINQMLIFQFFARCDIKDVAGDFRRNPGIDLFVIAKLHESGPLSRITVEPLKWAV